MDVVPSEGISVKSLFATGPDDLAPKARYQSEHELHLAQRLEEAMPKTKSCNVG